GVMFIGEKKGVMSTEDSSGWFIRRQTVSKINAGNVIESTTIEIKRNILSRLFTSFDVEPSLVERSGFGVTYIWINDRLGPAEVMKVQAKTNYLYPLLIILAASLAVLGIRRFSQTALVVKKSVFPMKTKGG